MFQGKGMLLSVKTVKKILANNFFYNISIKSRLLIYFISLILIPVSIISITIYSKSTGIITGKINSTLKSNLTTIESDILQKFDSIYDVTTNIYLNQDVIKIMSSTHPVNQTDIVSEMDTLDKILQSYQVQSPGRNILIPKLYLLNRPEYLMYSFSDKVSDTSVLEKEKWYLDMPAETKYVIVGLSRITVSSVSINTIKIAKRLFALNDIQIPFAGLLTIDVGIDSFNSTLDSSRPTSSSSIFIIDDSSNIVVSPDSALLGKNVANERYIEKITKDPGENYNSFIEKIDHSNILIAYEKIKPLGWTIITLSPLNELNGELSSFNRIMLILIAVCAIIGIGMAMFLADNIAYPIRKIVKSMSVVRSGNFDISIEYKRNDEFAYLINTYKKMVNDIKELISKLYISEANKREAELKLLQAQINPHFLYNTLDSVNWLAMKYKAVDISTMVTSLSDFFRYSLSKGKNIITLGDEKKQVESYLTIQKIRFKDKLDYSIDFPAEILGYLTVKLILQPIVENSIIHGIEQRRGHGTIDISAGMNDGIIEIVVLDNGAGTDVDELNSILEDKIGSSSFAIRNVNERIKHFFGNEFGIRFFNNENTGVKVVVRFPAVKNSEGLSNVKDDYSR